MFLVKSLERLKHPDRTIRRISRLDSQPRPFAVRFQLLVLTITSLKNLDRQNKQLGQRNLSQGMFLLDALGAMVVINMLDLVPEHRSELVFTIHQRQQALADINVPTRQGEGVNEVLLWDVMESVRQLAVGMRVNLTGMRVSSCSVSAIRYNRAAGLAGASTLRRSLTTTAATPIIKIPANVSPRFIGIAAACHDSAYRGKKLATARCPAR